MTVDAPVRHRSRRTLGGPRSRGDDAAHEQERVVRIPLGLFRLYAYRVRGKVRLGTIVEVDTPIEGTVRRPVVGFGRGGYDGPLKLARIVR